MPRFAVQWPDMLMCAPDRSHNGARQEFIRQFKPVLFMPRLRWRFTRGRGMKKLLRDSPLFNIDEVDFAFSVGELNRKADALFYFNTFPLDLERLPPPRKFNGLKIWHAYEYVFQSTAVNRLLEAGGVDYLLGYADHGRYCPFFQKHYPRYVDRVIPFPFGASKRFLVDAPWEKRKRKVIALGAVNLVDEPEARETLAEYARFYSHKRWAHEWRRQLVEHEADLTPIVDSHLPHFPQTKNSGYDALEMMTNYALFANDEGILAFPPARTYEGPAAGAAMISSDFAGYGDLGFRDGVNCVMHRKGDLADFQEKARHFLGQPERLRTIAEAGRRLVRTHYTHAAVAMRLGAQIDHVLATGAKPDPRLPESLI